jgi:hypothetical protein
MRWSRWIPSRRGRQLAPDALPSRIRGRYSGSVTTAEQVYEALRSLPEAERLRLVERIIHDLADAARQRTAEPPQAASLVGLWEDEPEVVEEMVEDTLRGREGRRLRTHENDVDER